MTHITLWQFVCVTRFIQYLRFQTFHLFMLDFCLYKSQLRQFVDNLANKGIWPVSSQNGWGFTSQTFPQFWLANQLSFFLCKWVLAKAGFVISDNCEYHYCAIELQNLRARGTIHCCKIIAFLEELCPDFLNNI